MADKEDRALRAEDKRFIAHSCEQRLGEVIEVQDTAFGEVRVIPKAENSCVVEGFQGREQVPRPEDVAMGPRMFRPTTEAMHKDDVRGDSAAE